MPIQLKSHPTDLLWLRSGEICCRILSIQLHGPCCCGFQSLSLSPRIKTICQKKAEKAFPTMRLKSGWRGKSPQILLQCQHAKGWRTKVTLLHHFPRQLSDIRRMTIRFKRLHLEPDVVPAVRCLKGTPLGPGKQAIPATCVRSALWGGCCAVTSQAHLSNLAHPSKANR